MGWITVETPNAVYKVVQEIHLRKSRLPPGIDAAILEMNMRTKSKNPRIFEHSAAYRDVISSNKNPLFTGDINEGTPAMRKQTMKAFNYYVAQTFLTLGLNLPPVCFSILAAVQSIPGGELGIVRKKLLKTGRIISDTIIPNMTPVDFRNALIAKKAEEIISTEMRQRLKRKPVIAIVYGAIHEGIVDCLRRPALRRRYLSAMKPEKLVGQDDLTKVVEMEYDPKTMQVKTKIIGETRLPRYTPPKRRMVARARLLRKKIRRWIK